MKPINPKQLGLVFNSIIPYGILIDYLQTAFVELE